MSSRSVPSNLRNLAKKTSLSLLYKLPPHPQRLQGRTIWVHPRARFSVSTKTFFKGERHVRAWLSDRLKPGEVFFDVGAHHGWVSMWAALLVGKEGAVYSFEPSPANLSVLHWHRERNHFTQWTIVPSAVSDEDVTARNFVLVDSGDSPMNSLTTGAPGMPLMKGRKVSSVFVKTVTLDTFCSEVGAKPNVVKVDVEGAELLVLNGARTLLSECCPTIILAVHPYWLPDGQSTAQILELLKTSGYSVIDSMGKQAESLSSGEYLCFKKS